MVETKQKKILIVEDDPQQMKFVSEILERKGFSILRASDGEEALELARSQKPDLILLDLVLPKTDGWRVCQKLKQDESYKAIPIVLMSGLIQEEYESQGAELGDAFLAKPVESEKLLGVVRQFLK